MEICLQTLHCHKHLQIPHGSFLVTEKVFSLGVSSGVGVNNSHADFAKSVSFFFFYVFMSRLMTKPTKWLCVQRRLRSDSAVWSESSLCAQWVAKDPSFLHADSEDSDQIGRMPRLIWVFAGCTTTLVCQEATQLGLLYGRFCDVKI